MQKLRDEHKRRLLLGEPEPVKPVSFSEAAEQFLGTSRRCIATSHSTAKRIGVSLASWRDFMAKRLISTWTRETCSIT